MAKNIFAKVNAPVQLLSLKHYVVLLTFKWGQIYFPAVSY